jgi:hypothetical protein
VKKDAKKKIAGQYAFLQKFEMPKIRKTVKLMIWQPTSLSLQIYYGKAITWAIFIKCPAKWTNIMKIIYYETENCLVGVGSNNQKHIIFWCYLL